MREGGRNDEADVNPDEVEVNLDDDKQEDMDN
jgi:hypothetical protein